MAKIDGDPFSDGDLLSFEEMNRILTNFYQASVPSNLQSGGFWVDSDTDKCDLKGISTLDEVIQATRSWDVSPELSGLPIVCNDGDVVVNDDEVVFNPTSP